jgi:hypothetical protein
MRSLLNEHMTSEAQSAINSIKDMAICEAKCIAFMFASAAVVFTSSYAQKHIEPGHVSNLLGSIGAVGRIGEDIGYVAGTLGPLYIAFKRPVSRMKKIADELAPYGK